jgi:hypothetical protein
LKKIQFLLLLLYATLAHAQEFSISNSPLFKEKSNYYDRYYKFGETYLRYSIETGPAQLAYTGTLRKVRFTINLESYDQDMKSVNKISLDDNKKGLGPFAPTAFILKNKLNVLYYRFVDDADIIKLYLAQIDPVTLTIEKTQEVFSIDQKNLWIIKTIDAITNNSTSVKFSADSSKILVTSFNKDNLYSCILDKELNITENTIIKNKVANDITMANAFVDNAGNKYYSYNYMPDKEFKRGIITESNKGGAAKFQDFKPIQEYAANDLFFAESKTGKIYVYANYYGDFLNEGIMLGTINPANFSIDKPQLFPYPDDFKQKMEKANFAEKQKGNLSVRRTDYTFYEFSDQTIGFIGYPAYATFAGPITGVFIHTDRSAVFTMLPRYTYAGKPSVCFSQMYKDQILLLYCDEEKNLKADLEAAPKYTKHEVNEVLATAVMNTNGKITNRQKIADIPGEDDYYFLADAERLNKNTFLIPVGRQRVNMSSYYLEINKLTRAKIQ